MATYHSPRDAQHQEKPVESAEEALKSQRESDDSRTTVKKSIEDEETRATLYPALNPSMPRGVSASHSGPNPKDHSVSGMVHCDPASAVRYPNIADATEEMLQFVEPAVERLKEKNRVDRPENRVDRPEKTMVDYEAVVFVYESQKELYVLNPGGDQRTANKGFKRSPQEPAEVSELGREGVFIRPLGSLQEPIDWYHSLIKWGDTCTDAAVRRTAWYPSSYVGVLKSGRTLALRVITLPQGADLTWLNGTRLSDGCKPFNLVAKEMLQIGHTGISEGLKAAFYHSVNVKEAYWLATDEQYRRTDPKPEKEIPLLEVEESPQPQPPVSKGVGGGKKKVLDGHKDIASRPWATQDEPAHRRLWQETEERVGHQKSKQSLESQEQSQLCSPPSSSAKLVETGNSGGNGTAPRIWTSAPSNRCSSSPTSSGRSTRHSGSATRKWCWRASSRPRTQGRTPYTRIFDRLMIGGEI